LPLSLALNLNLSLDRAAGVAGSARRRAAGSARGGRGGQQEGTPLTPILKVRGFSLDLIYSYFFVGIIS